MMETIMRRTVVSLLVLSMLAINLTAAGQTGKPAARSITVRTSPNAIVWVDEVRRGVTDATGSLEVRPLTAGRHTIRVRAKGFVEASLPILPTRRGVVNIPVKKPADEAELTFQQAEEQREKGGGEEGRKAAIELYRRALKLRPRFAAAHLGLARVLLSQEDHDGALQQIEEARRDRPNFAEASAVEGRILRAMPDEEGAMNSYRRSIREARGFQPEAHTGLGIVREERGDYEGAVASFKKAIEQLSDTEPVLYEFLGRNLEKLERWKEAVAAYEKYLELAPQGPHASAINSIIDQLRRQSEETPR